MASNALLMSIVVRLGSNMFLGCRGRNTYCIRARGTSGWIMFRIRLSVILDGVQSSVRDKMAYRKKVLLGLYLVSVWL